MTFEVEINGRIRHVSIESIGESRFRVKSLEIPSDAERTGLEVLVSSVPTDLGLSLRFDSGRVVDVAATERSRGVWLVQLPNADLTALVDQQRYQSRARGATSSSGEQRVVAPMPGRVVRVLVKAGDVVAARQGLVVVEAMKMENELGSPKAGRIKEISVSEGVSVEAGRLLVVVE